jgi:hypothetical protein
VQTAILKKAFYRVWQGALGMNQGGGGPKNLGTTGLEVTFFFKIQRCVTPTDDFEI